LSNLNHVDCGETRERKREEKSDESIWDPEQTSVIETDESFGNDESA
jgi:hypothetical protein